MNYRQTNNAETGSFIVRYSIDKDDDSLVLVCTVASFPAGDFSWLRMRKFSMRAIRAGKAFTAVFDNDGIDRSVDMSLFIDCTYHTIMKEENIPVNAA